MMKKRLLLGITGVLAMTLFTGCGEEQTAESAADPVSRAVQTHARAGQIDRESELKQISLALTMYANEHNDRMPESLDDLAPYLGGMDLSPFVYIGNIGRMPSNPAKIPVVLVRPQNSAGDELQLLMADGHVAKVNIPGLSGKNFREITEFLTRDLTDSTIKRKLLDNAAAL